MKSKLTRGLTLAALAAAALVAPAQPAVADTFFILPAGTACAFNLGFQSTGGNLHTKEFTDANGDTVRLLRPARACS